MTGGPFAQATGLDNIPLDNLGGTADLGADATDNSADVNVNGANDVAANAAAEAQEIAAVPDPQSPAGQAAIMAIIEKYHAKSAGTVEGSAATEQANGSHAADSGSSDNNAICTAEPISPPKGQPPQKSYKDFNTNWPLDSWSVTEPDDGYQIAYIRLLSKFVH